MKIAIANEYGSVDLTKTTLDGRYKHVPGKRLQPLCRKLGFKCAEAIVEWCGSQRRGWKPRTDGVVVSAASAPKLRKQSRRGKIATRRKGRWPRNDGEKTFDGNN